MAVNSEGSLGNSSPRKSLIWDVKIIKAIPLVKPTTRGIGINLSRVPSLNSPNNISMNPARIVEIISPWIPYTLTIPTTITTKAPVGPPICTRLQPRNEIMKPATIAVTIPLSGDTPDAMANAMARGRARIPTIIPEKTSVCTCWRV